MAQDVPRHTNRFEEEYLPMARTDDLVITRSRDEMLVYDQRAHHIHHLNPVAAAVWHHCDGHTPIQSISLETGTRADHVLVALRSTVPTTFVDRGRSRADARCSDESAKNGAGWACCLSPGDYLNLGP